MTHTGKVFIEESPNRLEALLSERVNCRGNQQKQERIDQRIWDLFGEEWTILFTDLSGFSKGSSKFGIIHFVQTIIESERIFTPIIENYDGFIVKKEGDTLIVMFRSHIKAIKCAIDLQKVSEAYNVGRPEEEHVLLCCGLGKGRILRVPGPTVDIFGEEVNLSAKLGEDTAGPGEILLTARLAQQLTELDGLTVQQVPNEKAGGRPFFKLHY